MQWCSSCIQWCSSCKWLAKHALVLAPSQRACMSLHRSMLEGLGKDLASRLFFSSNAEALLVHEKPLMISQACCLRQSGMAMMPMGKGSGLYLGSAIWQRQMWACVRLTVSFSRPPRILKLRSTVGLRSLGKDIPPPITCTTSVVWYKHEGCV